MKAIYALMVIWVIWGAVIFYAIFCELMRVK